MSDSRDRGRPPVGRRRFLKLTGVGAGAGVLAGCLENGDDDPTDDDDGANGDDADGGADGDTGGGEDADADDEEFEGELLVGGVHPYTGPFAQVAREFEAGFEFALAEVNADGGVLGHELVHEGVDSELNPANAVSIATQFVERDDAVALTGPISSDVGIRVAATAEDLEVPVVFNQVGSDAAISRESRYTYRLGLLPAPTMAQAQAQFIEEGDFETVRAVIADYAYGHAFDEAIAEHFPDDVDVETVVAPFGEDDFVPYLRDMPDDIDVLIATSHPPGAYTIFRQHRELDMNPEYVFGISEAKPAWEALGDDITDGWLATHQPYPYTDRYAEVGQRFYDSTGEYFGILASLGYVAATMIAAAIENAGEPDPVAISEEIRNIEHDSLFAEPVQYTEYGELDEKRVVFSGFEQGTPEYYPDGEYDLVEEFLSEPLEGFDPGADGD